MKTTTKKTITQAAITVIAIVTANLVLDEIRRRKPEKSI